MLIHAHWYALGWSILTLTGLEHYSGSTWNLILPVSPLWTSCVSRTQHSRPENVDSRKFRADSIHITTWRLCRPWRLARGARWEPSWPRPGWASPRAWWPWWPRSWYSSLLPCPYTSTRLRSFGQCLPHYIKLLDKSNCFEYSWRRPPCNETQLSGRHCSLTIDLLNRQSWWQAGGSTAQGGLVVQTTHNLEKFSEESWMDFNPISLKMLWWNWDKFYSHLSKIGHDETGMDFNPTSLKMLWWFLFPPLQSNCNDQGCGAQAGLEAAQRKQSEKWKRPGVQECKTGIFRYSQRSKYWEWGGETWSKTIKNWPLLPF